MSRELAKIECSCSRCQSYCQRIPGWFRPGEAEKAAALLGLGLPEFFAKHLVADFWVEADGLPTTFVLRPASVSDEPWGCRSSEPAGGMLLLSRWGLRHPRSQAARLRHRASQQGRPAR